jgi:predicted secreted acid phosphatase
MTKKTKKDDDKKYIPDDRICIFYVADRIYDFENIKDHKKLQKEITEFKEELLQNIGVDVMIKREAKYHK